MKLTSNTKNLCIFCIVIGSTLLFVGCNSELGSLNTPTGIRSRPPAISKQTLTPQPTHVQSLSTITSNAITTPNMGETGTSSTVPSMNRTTREPTLAGASSSTTAVQSSTPIHANPTLKVPPSQTPKPSFFSDSFEGSSIDPTIWSTRELDFAYIENGQLHFNTTVNDTGGWKSYILIPSLDTHGVKQVARVDWIVQMNTSPGSGSGVLGLEAPCVSNSKLLDIYIGGSEGRLTVTFTIDQKPNEYKSEKVFADGQPHLLSAVWTSDGVAVFADSQTIFSGLPCLKPKRLLFFAGLPAQTQVQGYLDEIKVYP